MKNTCLKCLRLLLCAASLMPFSLFAQQEADTTALIDRVAEAMGGRQAILDVHTLEANGYGLEAYFWGGGNVTGDPMAPQKWAENPGMSSIWDFDNDRYLTQYRHNFLFPFGGIFGHSFALSGWGYDGTVGYTITENGNGQRLANWSTAGAWFKPDGYAFRRFEALSHPLAAVRAVLSGKAQAQNLRIENGLQLVDLVIDAGRLTMAIDPTTGLPRFVRWDTPHQNLGQLIITTTGALQSGSQDGVTQPCEPAHDPPGNPGVDCRRRAQCHCPL